MFCCPVLLHAAADCIIYTDPFSSLTLRVEVTNALTQPCNNVAEQFGDNMSYKFMSHSSVTPKVEISRQTINRQQTSALAPLRSMADT